MFACWITQEHHTLLQNEIKPGDYDRDLKKKKKPVSFWERIKKQNEMQDSKISHVINLAFDTRLNSFIAKPQTKAKHKYQNKGQKTDFPRMVYTICGVTEVG